MENKKAGPMVHYAFGELMGAVYDASVKANPAANALADIPFGAILFAAADEMALPMLGLSDKPAAYGLSTHFMDWCRELCVASRPRRCGIVRS